MKILIVGRGPSAIDAPRHAGLYDLVIGVNRNGILPFISDWFVYDPPGEGDFFPLTMLQQILDRQDISQHVSRAFAQGCPAAGLVLPAAIHIYEELHVRYPAAPFPLAWLDGLPEPPIPYYCPPLDFGREGPLYMPRNVFGPAFHWACKQGPDEISLIGFEFGARAGMPDRYDCPEHFRDPAQFNFMRQESAAMIAQAETAGIKITNLSF